MCGGAALRIVEVGTAYVEQKLEHDRRQGGAQHGVPVRLRTHGVQRGGVVADGRFDDDASEESDEQRNRLESKANVVGSSECGVDNEYEQGL